MAYIHVLGLQAALCSAVHAAVDVYIAHWTWFLPSPSLSQVLGGQELDWGDAALPGIMDGGETSADTWGGPPFALPGSDVDNDRLFTGGCYY